MEKSEPAKLRFRIGDRIVSKKYGNGVVTDVNPEDPTFCYNATFEDGTRAWYNGRGTTLASSEE